MSKKISYIILSAIFLVLFSFSVFSYCGGEYTTGNWIVNTTVTCSDEDIPVTGTLTVQDDSISAEIAVTQFTLQGTDDYIYDLTNNETNFTATIPNVDPTDNIGFTNNWDSQTGQTFNIAMNESTHSLHVFANYTGGSSWMYYFNLDDDDESGGDDGEDLLLGFFPGLGFVITCFNETLNDNLPFSTNDNSGIQQCGNIPNWDSTFDGTFTIYYNVSGNATEIIINQSGAWIDKIIFTFDGDGGGFYQTLFKNSAAATASGSPGILTLNNVNLTITSNLTVSDSATFNVTDSNITFNMSTNGSTYVLFDENCFIDINKSTLTSNATDYIWGWSVGTESYNLTNNNISFNGVDEPGNYENNFAGASGGLIYNNNFSSCVAGTRQCLFFSDFATGLNMSSNYFSTTGVPPWMSGVDGANIENNIFFGRLYLDGVTNSNITNNQFRTNGFLSLSDVSDLEGSSDLIIKNNNFSDTNPGVTKIVDYNASTSNTVIYSNSFGEIKWEEKTNVTITDTFIFGTDVFIENNNIGLENNINFTNLNTSAQLTFYGLSWTEGNDIQLLKEGIRCDTTDDCNISYSGTTLSANVSSFSNYTTTESISYCGGAYNSSGNWLVNITLTCSDETIIVDGSLLIQDTSETEGAIFPGSAGTEYFDLSSFTEEIIASDADYNINTPNVYTTDLNADSNEEFYIAMNESANRLIIFMNSSDASSDQAYTINADNDDTTGVIGFGAGLTGSEILIGYSSGSPYVACWNMTAPGSINMMTNGSSCDHLTSNMNGPLAVNTTVYYTVSGRATEVVLTFNTSWENKKIADYNGGTEGMLIFKNSAVLTGAAANLTLDNVTLNISSNFNVSSGYLDIQNSTINFNLNTNGGANLTADFGSFITVNQTTITTNDTTKYWGLGIFTLNFTFTNNEIYYKGFALGSSTRDFQPDDSATVTGLVYNNIFSNCFNTPCLSFEGTNGVNVSNNTILDYGVDDRFKLTDTNNAFVANNIFSVAEFGNCNHCMVENNNFSGEIHLNWIDNSESISQNITLKNNYFNDSITDLNLTAIHHMIYFNDFGQISWNSKTNLSITGDLNIGAEVFIEDNNIGILDNTNLINLNSTAEIKFYGLGYSYQPYVNKDGIRCDTLDTCNITSWDGSTLIVNVSSFSNYTTSAADILPTVNLESPANDSTSSNITQTLSFNVTSNVATGFNCSLYLNDIYNQSNAATLNATSTDFSVTLTTGVFNWNMSCDNSSNISSSIRVLTIDNTAPSVSLVSPANNLNTSTPSQELVFNHTDNFSTTANCSLYIDNTFNTSNETVINATNTNFSVSFAEGTHSWNITCIDDVLNENSLLRTITVDSTAPTVNLISPADNINTSTNSQTLSFNYTDSFTSSANCSLYIDETYNQSNATTINATSTSFSVTLAETEYTWNVTCVDDVSNEGNSLRTLTLDSSAPVVTLITPINLTLLSSNTTSFSFNYTDAVTADLSCILYVNGTANQTNSSTVNGTTTTFANAFIGSGDKNWYVTCTDSASNAGDSSLRVITIPTLNIAYTVNVTANTTQLLNATDNTNLSFMLGGNESGTVNVSEYVSNPSNTTATSSNGFAALVVPRFMVINTSSNLESNLTWSYLRIYYSASDLPSSIDESTLVVYYLNETSGQWQAEADSGVDTTNNFVWANVTHFSVFSLGGSATVTATASTGGGSGGGGGGSSNVFNVGDITKSGVELVMKRSDKLKFMFEGTAHSIYVTSITVATVTMSVASTPVEIAMHAGDKQTMDLNNDGFNDISIELLSIAAGKASIKITSLKNILAPINILKYPEPATKKTKTEDVKETTKQVQKDSGAKVEKKSAVKETKTATEPIKTVKKKSKTGLWTLLIVAIIAAIIASMLFFKKKK